MAEPIAQPSGANLLLQLLGTQGSTSGTSNTLAQQLSNILTQGSTTGATSGTSSATTSTTAELAPLIAAFTQAQQGMDPAQLSALISSIFTEGAAAVPALTQQYANSTGSRVSGNSGLNLALGDLNRNLSSQAVQALLQYNQGSQQTAANTAAQIAANTRQTTQQGQQTQQTSGTTNQSQQQTGTTNTNQTQQQRQQSGVNPNMAALVGAGGTALNWLDKKGVFDGIFNRGGGTGTIGTASTALPTLTNGGGASAGTLSAPAASQGFLSAAPAAAPAVSPYGNTSSIGAAGGGGMAPIVAPNMGGISSLGGYTNAGGGLGTGFDMGFGSLPTGLNAFGTLGTESLGTNLDFGSNPFGYEGSSGGITGVVNGAGGGGFDLGNFGGSLFGGIGDALGGAADWIGSFFADGGVVGHPDPTRRQSSNYTTDQMRTEDLARRNYENSPTAQMLAALREEAARTSRALDYNAGAGRGRGYADGGQVGKTTLPAMNIFEGTRLRREMEGGLTPMPYTMQAGTNVRVPAGTPTGQDPTMAAVMQLIPFLLQKGAGFADGGQIQTGGTPARVRNQNYMGPRQERERSEAMNYEGYATPAAVGSSQPAGGSPSLASVVSPAMAAAPGFVAQSGGDSRQQALDLFRQSVAQQQAAAEAARLAAGGAGGSGGVGEGAAPGQNEADNGQAGIGPSGIAAAPPGTPAAVSTGLGQIGLAAPGLSSMLAFIAAMAAAVNAANQGIAGGGPGGAASAAAAADADADSPDIGVTVSVPGLPGLSTNTGGDGAGGVGVGASGGPGSGTDGGPGDSGVGGDSAGDGTSGSAGTSAGADGWKDGGLVRGPGTGTSDSIPVKSRQAGGKQIHYSDGEYVIPADVVDSLGVDLFDRLIAAHHTPAARQ